MTQNVPELESNSVRLRPFSPSDVAERLALGRSPEIVRCFGGNPDLLPDYGEQEARSWVKGNLAHPLCWAVETDVAGYARVSNRVPNSGAYALVLDNVGQDTSLYSQAAAILNLNLASAQDIELSFAWNDLADEYTAAYDGVFIREDENDAWVKIYNFSGDSNNGVYQSATIDLDSEASNAGVALFEKFQLKFSFYDNYPANPTNYGLSDGYAIDDLSVTCLYDADPLVATFGPDSQQLAPGEAQTYTLVLSNPDSGLHSGLTVTGTIGSDFELDGFISKNGGSGTISTPELTGSPAIILSSGQILGGEALTLTLPVSAATNLAAGTTPSITITYASDQDAAGSSASISAAILNVAPVTADDSVTIYGVNSSTIDPLVNDSDLNGDSLILAAVADPASGSLSIINNQLTYDPVSGYVGTEVISYTVRDGGGLSASASLTLQVNANPPPLAMDDIVYPAQSGAVTIDVLTNDDSQDGSELTLSGVGTPANGTVEISNSTLVYTPESSFKGSDTFTYTVQNGSNLTADGTVTIVIPNTAPIAADDTVAVVSGQSVTINPLDNDSDQNGDPIVISAIGTPSLGTAVQIDSSTIVYTASLSLSTAVLTYTISDGDLDSDVGTISIFVTSSENEEEVIIESFPVEQESTVEQTIETEDGKLEIKIPADAIPAGGKEVTYQTLVTPTQPLPVYGAGTYFVLELVNQSDTIVDNPVFDPPLEVKISYNPDNLAGISTKNLIVMYFDETEGKWLSVPIIARDEINHTLTISLSHFTEFAVTQGYLVFSPFIVE
ncbi:MAG: Ig-like domain-containing protein [Chloroflexota bacterium]